MKVFVIVLALVAAVSFLDARADVVKLNSWETGNLSLVAIPANMLVLPVVPLTMFFSFIAGLVGVVAPALAVFFGLPAHALLSYIIAVGQFFASSSLAQISVPEFPFVIVALLYALIAYAVLRIRKERTL